MDNFTAVYKILKSLEAAMDLPEFELEQVGPAKLGVSQERWSRYIEMMADIGLIKGVSVSHNIIGGTEIEDSGVRITLKGLEYLQENSFMKKAYRVAKGITDIIPG